MKSESRGPSITSQAKRVLVSESSRNSAKNSDTPKVNLLKHELDRLAPLVAEADKKRQEAQRAIEPYSTRAQKREHEKYIRANAGVAAWLKRKAEMQKKKDELVVPLRKATEEHQRWTRKYRAIKEEIGKIENDKPNLREMVNGLMNRVDELEKSISRIERGSK